MFLPQEKVKMMLTTLTPIELLNEVLKAKGENLLQGRTIISNIFQLLTTVRDTIKAKKSEMAKDQNEFADLKPKYDEYTTRLSLDEEVSLIFRFSWNLSPVDFKVKIPSSMV
jgi:hypothetical protein